jgi:PAS domain-containing protein
VLSEIIAGVLTVPDVGSVVSFLSQELEKLIAFSGTPTVVWRRTGEICLVAPEFITLTEWSREELLGRRKYIYEVRS